MRNNSSNQLQFKKKEGKKNSHIHFEYRWYTIKPTLIYRIYVLITSTSPRWHTTYTRHSAMTKTVVLVWVRPQTQGRKWQTTCKNVQIRPPQSHFKSKVGTRFRFFAWNGKADLKMMMNLQKTIYCLFYMQSRILKCDCSNS